MQHHTDAEGAQEVTQQMPAPLTQDDGVSEALLEVLEAALLAVNAPLSVERLQTLFTVQPSRKLLLEALEQLQTRYAGRVAEGVEIASGWRIQVRERFGEQLASLWEEKPPRFSRALLETLALIVYRQPITRGEIEEIRSVSLSPNIVRTLMEREWVRSLGVREVPGRPELLGTTRQFLDDFGIKSLEELPSLPEIRDLDALASALQILTGEEQPELLAASEREALAKAQAETSLADAQAVKGGAYEQGPEVEAEAEAIKAEDGTTGADADPETDIRHPAADGAGDAAGAELPEQGKADTDTDTDALDETGKSTGSEAR